MLYVESDNKNIDSFFLGETPITQKQWKTVMGYSNCEFTGEDLPVESVEWVECIKFAVILSFITGRTFWLPTKQQWVYAARGGKYSKGYKYSGSDNIDDIAWYEENSNETTHPVATKLPNELGLYDMNGNVNEWCTDSIVDYTRVIIGGSFDYDIDPLDNILDNYEDQMGVISEGVGTRIVLLSDEHFTDTNFEKEQLESIDAYFNAYNIMIYEVYEFGSDCFDYDLVLFLLKLTEGNTELRSRLKEILSDWIQSDEF